MFEYEWKCMWDHVDPAGIAYFPELINACHQAGDELLQQAGYPYWETRFEHGFHFPLVETGQDFQRPVKAGDVITIEVDTDMGSSSLRFEFTGRHEDGEVAFTAYEQHVCVSNETEKPTDIPDDFREAIAEFVGESDD